MTQRHEPALGQTHFIESVKGVQVALIIVVPGMDFGSALCEWLVGWLGTDADAIDVYW